MKHFTRSRPKLRSGFTLIELLVVITIIVVLLALLVPAMDKAIYRAELLQCATNQKGIASGVQLYAVDFRRTYPYRPDMRGGNNGPPRRISTPAVRNDIRPLLRPYISVNGHLMCPFAPAKIDYEGSKRDTFVVTSYLMFYGVQYQDGEGVKQKGMLRLGDSLEWEGRMFKVLAVDNDQIDASIPVSYSSHPDWEGAARPQVVQDEPPGGLGEDHTFSRWAYETDRRPPIDTQFALDDGSVALIEQVTWDETETTGLRRMAKAPNYANAQSYTGGTGTWIHLPVR